MICIWDSPDAIIDENSCLRRSNTTITLYHQRGWVGYICAVTVAPVKLRRCLQKKLLTVLGEFSAGRILVHYG
jgi:hypothetical protein